MIDEDDDDDLAIGIRFAMVLLHVTYKVCVIWACMTYIRHA